LSEVWTKADSQNNISPSKICDKVLGNTKKTDLRANGTLLAQNFYYCSPSSSCFICWPNYFTTAPRENRSTHRLFSPARTGLGECGFFKQEGTHLPDSKLYPQKWSTATCTINTYL